MALSIMTMTEAATEVGVVAKVEVAAAGREE